MSLMMEPTTHEIEDRAEATEQVRDQLHQHLVDVNELCSQVRAAYEAGDEDDDLQELFAELLDAMEQHHGMISEQLADMSEFGELPEHEMAGGVANYAR